MTIEFTNNPRWGSYRVCTQALTEAGIMVGGAPLQPPPLATTVRQRDGKRQVQDGPYAETKEQLGGYYVIDVPDLDKALDWAARCPAAATGAVEVRPNLHTSPTGRRAPISSSASAGWPTHGKRTPARSA